MLQSQKYAEERIDLKARIANAQERLIMIDNIELSKERFVLAVRRFMEFRELTTPMLRELIERIDVYETEGVGNNRTQRIKIHYKFLGEVEIDDPI